MDRRKRLVGILICGYLFFNANHTVIAQTTEDESTVVENAFQTRTEANISFEPLKKLEVSFIPELRWDESVQVDKFLFESKLAYKPIKGLTVGAGYRFIANLKEDDDTEYMHRIALDAQYQKKFGRWKPAVRIKYTNFSDEASKSDILKYRAKLSYNIKKSKLTPVVSFETYHDLTDSEIQKYRYSIGTAYKLNKKASINAGYAMDYYMHEFLNKHIINLGYSYKF